MQCTGKPTTDPQPGHACSSPARQGSAQMAERRAGALTQRHRPLLQGWMQVSASATLAFPTAEAKGVPGVTGAGSS